MNRWTKAAIGCARVLILIGLTGCGGGDDGSAGTGGDPALVGNWRMTAMSVNGSGLFAPGTIGWDVQMQLDADGSATATEVWQGKTESSGGGWSAGGGQLHIAAGWYDWTGPYTVGASQFTLSSVPNYDGEGHTGSFVFARQ
jgi:hypothetical protein